MSYLVLASIVLLVGALGWSLSLMVRLGEWRIGLFSLMIAFVAAHQFVAAAQVGLANSLSALGSLNELPGLFVSVICLAAIALLGTLFRNYRAEIESVERSSKMFELQQAVMRRLIEGGSMRDTLSELCKAAEKVFPGAVASVLLMNEKTNELNFAAGPNVPGDLATELEGMVSGAANGSCGTAAFTGETTIVSDTTRDPRWANLQFLVERFNVYACWSIPIHGEDKRVLGTFALSFPTPCEPTPFHHRILNISSDMASIAIGKLAAQEEKERLANTIERSQRMQSMAVVAGGVAHDLNNMLGPLVGYPDMIMRQLPESSAARRQLKIMARAARQAANVIQDLLTLARRGRYEMSTVHLGSILNRYLESPAFDEAQRLHPRVQVIHQMDPAAKVISGSETHLSKAIMNLMNNAFEAMPDGGTLHVGLSQQYTRSLHSAFPGFVAGDYLVLSVSDTGHGIAAEDLSMIFEPYFSRKKMGRCGSGLGLSVVRGIVKDHNGFYDVVSFPERGTEFLLYFPVAREQHAEPVAETGDATSSGTETILVVDDEEPQRVMAKSLLEGLGYTVDTVTSGQEALEYVTAKAVDLVILDMIMEGGMDGLDTYEAILKVRPEQRAIVASGYSATERVNRMQDLGAGAYVRKPYTLAAISAAVRLEMDRDRSVPSMVESERTQTHAFPG